VATRGTKCQHHKRKRATKKKATRRSASGKRVRCRPGRNQQCAAKTQCGTRCKQYAAGRSKFCRVHKGKPLKSPKRTPSRKKNPHDPFAQLQDRWSLPRLPAGTIR
jgi:hypothetical protein